jgi:hypothetical protein
MQSWKEDDPLGAFIAATKNGWTDNVIGLQWFKKVFDPETRHVFPLYRLLILDGHTSHVSYLVVKFCRDNNIILLCLPAHATALIQPLDVGVFSPLSKAWSKVCEDRLVGGLHMREQMFPRYGSYFLNVFSFSLPSTVCTLLLALKSSPPASSKAHLRQPASTPLIEHALR